MTEKKWAIEVHQLSKTYRSGVIRRHQHEALKNVTFDVGRGQIFGLLGPNGAGKTTFIKILLGIVRKSSGTATLLGRPAGTRAGRRRVGYLPENLRIPRHHTAQSALELYGQLSGISLSEIRVRSDALLDSVGLADWKRVSVKKFSKGMLQRLGLAQSLLHDPDLLFLDEPTDGLDPVGRTHVRNVLTDLKAQNKTIFLNSHLLQEVEMVCDRVAILNNGELKAVGSVEEIAPRQQGLEVNLELSGPLGSIQDALRGRDTQLLESRQPDRHRFRLRVNDQPEVDACVDQLRRTGVSVISMAPQKTSLEETFLQYLAVQAEAV